MVQVLRQMAKAIKTHWQAVSVALFGMPRPVRDWTFVDGFGRRNRFVHRKLMMLLFRQRDWLGRPINIPEGQPLPEEKNRDEPVEDPRKGLVDYQKMFGLGLLLVFVPGLSWSSTQYNAVDTDPIIRVPAPIVSSHTVTTTSKVVLAENANRIAIECGTLASNTTTVFLNDGSAATINHFPIEAGGVWDPPHVSTVAIHGITYSGNQAIRCREYSY